MEINGIVNEMNHRAIHLLDGLIDFKENILGEVSRGRLFNANYPLLIQHIIRETRLYRATVKELMEEKELKEFWIAKLHQSYCRFLQIMYFERQIIISVCLKRTVIKQKMR